MEMHPVYPRQPESGLFRHFERCILQSDMEGLEKLCREGFEETDSGTDVYGTNLYQTAITHGNIGANLSIIENIYIYNGSRKISFSCGTYNLPIFGKHGIRRNKTHFMS